MDVHLSISDGYVKTQLYDKPNYFDFDIVKFPFLDVPRSTSYGVYSFSGYSFLLAYPVMLRWWFVVNTKI